MNKVIQYDRISASTHTPVEQSKTIQSLLGPEDTEVASFTERSVAWERRLRPGVRDVLAYLDKHRVDAMVVYSVDRLARTASELDELVERLRNGGVAVRTLADSPRNS